MKKQLSENLLLEYREKLAEDEKSVSTIDKYLRDIEKFYDYIEGSTEEINKKVIMEYKSFLQEHYKVTSANSMLVVLNGFFVFLGWEELRVRQFKVQKRLFCTNEEKITKEEYALLLNTAKENNKPQLNLLMQAICSTGIRVSEHRFLTVKAIKKGCMNIHNKGKSRVVFLPRELCIILTAYCNKNHIIEGPIFVSKSGNPLNRSNIWRMMKGLCSQAGIRAEKVFPHNLRHLFAFTFYSVEKDLLRLAEVFGHSSIETTRIYTISTGEEHKNMLSKLGLTCVYEY